MSLIQKAKQGKNVDYNKERLKKVREAQYEILNNLDLELKKVEDAKKNSERKAEFSSKIFPNLEISILSASASITEKFELTLKKQLLYTKIDIL